jgi:hypothetical protein
LFEGMRRIDLPWEIVKYRASLLLMFMNFVALISYVKHALLSFSMKL